MRALCLTATGGPQHLELCDLPDPGGPGPGEVRVGMKAVALNHLDLFVAEGLPNVPIHQFPHPVAADGAGVVTAIGSDVESVSVGDRVIINPGLSCGKCPECSSTEEVFCREFRLLGEHRSGTAVEHLILPARNVRRFENDWSWPEAAAFTLSTLTAWRMLTSRAQLREGESTLIWGIGGGVALQALKIANHLGARTAVTSSSDHKLEMAQKHGALCTVNHATEKDLAATVRTQMGGKLDVVVDSVGKSTWPTSLRLLKPGGRLVTCGATSGHDVSVDLRKLFWFQWSLLGSTMGTSAEFHEIVDQANQNNLRPTVDSVFELEDGARAYQRLAEGAQFGKIGLAIEG